MKLFDKLECVDLSEGELDTPCLLGPVDTLKTGTLSNGVR